MATLVLVLGAFPISYVATRCFARGDKAEGAMLVIAAVAFLLRAYVGPAR